MQDFDLEIFGFNVAAILGMTLALAFKCRTRNTGSDMPPEMANDA
jgi:hypothetical protein